MDEYDIPKEAIASVEESGIVFIDEIDKLVSSGDYRGYHTTINTYTINTPY